MSLGCNQSYMNQSTILHAQKPLAPQALFHGVVMTVGWIACQHIAVWALLFRNRFRFAIYVHAIAMTCLLILTALGAATIVTYKGIQVITKNYYHTIFGLVVCCFTILVSLMGVIAKYKEGSAKTNPQMLDRLKYIHILLGWLLIAASRIPLYDQWITKLPQLCLPLFYADLISFFLYVYMKLTQPRMESVKISKKKSMKTVYIKQIRKLRELQHFNGDYFIFNDYVYLLDPLYSSHPGGLAIISKIKGREVDRFLYGMQPLETLQTSIRVSHSSKSISLAGEPIAKIQPATLYQKMDELNEAKVSVFNFYQSSKRIYTLYLSPVNNTNLPFSYKGYTDISELGKYFAVTIASQKTRLYSMVNFLQRKTVMLVEEISKGDVFDEKQKEMLEKNVKSFSTKEFYNAIHQWTDLQVEQKLQKININEKSKEISQFNIQTEEIQEKQNSERISNQSIGKKIKKNHIPLLIKKYDKGQVTSVFLTHQFKGEILISRPRGRGLALQDLLETPKPYNIYIFTGGTGIYPFADTIDLLFKELLIEKKNIFSDAIIKSDPILQHKPFEDFQFKIYISVITIEELHPITLFQLQFLALHNRVDVYVKSSTAEDKSIIERRYPNLSINQLRFENIIWQLNQQQVSKIYACGPTRMTRAVLNELERAYWSPRKYLIL